MRLPLTYAKSMREAQHDGTQKPESQRPVRNLRQLLVRRMVGRSACQALWGVVAWRWPLSYEHQVGTHTHAYWFTKPRAMRGKAVRSEVGMCEKHGSSSFRPRGNLIRSACFNLWSRPSGFAVGWGHELPIFTSFVHVWSEIKGGLSK